MKNTKWLMTTLIMTASMMANSLAGCANPDLGDGSVNLGDAGLMTLTPINFASDVALGEDPTMFALAGGGMVNFAGGSAGTMGIPSLYFNDSFSWDLVAGGTSTITFTGLDVRIVRFYFAHTGETGATLIAADAMGATVGMADSSPAIFPGDPNAIVEIDAQGATILSLTIEVPAGATVAIDQLVVIVPQ